MKATGVGRFHWILPAAKSPSAARMEEATPVALKLANMASCIAGLNGERIEPVALRQALRVGLQARGLLGGTGQNRLRHAEAGRAYAAFLAPLAGLEQIGGLPATEDAAAAELARLIGTIRSGIHPVRSLASMAWLFRDVEEFLMVYRSTAFLEELRSVCPVPSRERSTRAREVLKDQFLAFVAAGESISSAARSLHLDPSTGTAWAANVSIATPRRPKVLGGVARNKAITLLPCFYPQV